MSVFSRRKLFIPRKNSLQNPLYNADPQEYLDQLANWLAIENWANGLGVGLRFATRTVGAYNALDDDPSHYDYFCDGVNDASIIQEAIDDIINSSWGEGLLLLSEGQFRCAASLGFGSVCSLRGTGSYENLTEIIFTSEPTIGTSYMDSLQECRDVRVALPTNISAAYIGISGTVFDNVVLRLGNGAVGSIGMKIHDDPSWIRDSTVTGGSRTNVAGVQLGNGGIIHHSYVSASQGITWEVPLSGVINYSQVSACQVEACVKEGIIFHDKVEETSILGGWVKKCGDATHDAIVIDGKRNQIQQVMSRRSDSDAGVAATRYGLSVVATALDCITINNDLKNSGATASYNDAGTGTIKNLDGSANNWNRL